MQKNEKIDAMEADGVLGKLSSSRSGTFNDRRLMVVFLRQE
jgi:hypothetical protein